jgi:ribonuclease-3 family protein
MNKEEINNVLLKYNLDKNEYVIISTASLVLRDIKNQAGDIDMAVSDKLNKYLQENYHCKLEKVCEENDQTYEIYMLDDVLNFSTHYYNQAKYDIINSYKLQTIEDIIALKKKLNRPKDLADLKLISSYLNKNSLELAYLGDAVYEIYIRRYLTKQGNFKVKDLQEKAINYVSAKSQSKFLDRMIADNFLTENELDVVKRARNHKTVSHPKNTSIIVYKKATGLEALLGYLDLTNQTNRIKEIMKYIEGE